MRLYPSVRLANQRGAERKREWEREETNDARGLLLLLSFFFSHILSRFFILSSRPSSNITVCLSLQIDVSRTFDSLRTKQRQLKQNAWNSSYPSWPVWKPNWFKSNHRIVFHRVFFSISILLNKVLKYRHVEINRHCF
jgi:hypothetical protein